MKGAGFGAEGRSGAWTDLGNLVFLDLVAECAEADLQQIRGARLDPSGTFQGLAHQVLFDM